MDPDYRMEAEQLKEEERRVRVRKERKQEQDRQYEERLLRTKQRAAVSPIKKVFSFNGIRFYVAYWKTCYVSFCSSAFQK